MSYEIKAAVYSVVSIRPDDVERITKAYLYGHTVVDAGFDLPSICDTTVTAVLLRTEVERTVHDKDEASTEIQGLLRRAYDLANYQVNRFASGLYAGRVCGSKQEAIEYVSELVR